MVRIHSHQWVLRCGPTKLQLFEYCGRNDLHRPQFRCRGAKSLQCVYQRTRSPWLRSASLSSYRRNAPFLHSFLFTIFVFPFHSVHPLVRCADTDRECFSYIPHLWIWICRHIRFDPFVVARSLFALISFFSFLRVVRP
jgi:hypothetical protein